LAFLAVSWAAHGEQMTQQLPQQHANPSAIAAESQHNKFLNMSDLHRSFHVIPASTVLPDCCADVGFGVGHTRETETKGIWVWGQPQVVGQGSTQKTVGSNAAAAAAACSPLRGHGE
jgi:hypothetical protein